MPGPRHIRTDQDLLDLLGRIDGKGYKAYKTITGRYRFPGFLLLIDHVQGDPFAAPSRIRVRVGRSEAGLVAEAVSSRIRTVAACDFLTRIFYKQCCVEARGNRGSGKSGLIAIDRPLQQILERTSMTIGTEYVEARFFMGLPARGRGISGEDARAMFFEELPRIVDKALLMKNLSGPELVRHVETVEDAEFARGRLDDLGLMAFVADGALLPRASGIDPSPLETADLFHSTESLRVEMTLPNSGRRTGMGIPRGVTLIVGGGYHGKSTLLNALECGVYNHIPGDGREMVVTTPGAVKVRAADGRNIEKADISPFINNLPGGQDTRSFSTKNASGSTSQAANIVEALEMGADALLLDEDTSATNFMIRDLSMQRLIAGEQEPITPFIDKVRQLYTDRGVSTVLVMGGSGDYFSVADHVIRMADYQPLDVTREAKQVAETRMELRRSEGGDRFGDVRRRAPVAASFTPNRRDGRYKVSAVRMREIVFGQTVVDMGDVAQVVDTSQTRAIGYAIHRAMKYMDGARCLKEVVDMVVKEINETGLECLPPYLVGDLARFRSFELAAAINRMRTLQVRQVAA
jgi:predicted ABC-class ATPase